jgi:hypothetical protein
MIKAIPAGSAGELGRTVRFGNFGSRRIKDELMLVAIRNGRQSSQGGT